VISIDDFMALAIIRKEKIILVRELAAKNFLLSHGSSAYLDKLGYQRLNGSARRLRMSAAIQGAE
jgi:hypothetical protein